MTVIHGSGGRVEISPGSVNAIAIVAVANNLFGVHGFGF
jgi:hypothetical protein